MALTPMMRQYLDIKEANQDKIIFYRLGDFYEMFFEDAILASKELELTLTGRDCGLEERAPMCGVPYHAAEGYIAKLVDKGYKVAICEQMEEASTAKDLVRRDIVRVITPGTVTETSMLIENEHCYILCIYSEKEAYGIAYADVSTGAFYVELAKNKADLQNILIRISPKEIIFDEADMDIASFFANDNYTMFINGYLSWPFHTKNAIKTITKHFNVADAAVFGLEKDSLCINAAGALLEYLLETQKNSLGHIKSITFRQSESFMAIDTFTMRNLELVENMRDKTKRGSLLWLLDKTKTAMGGRLLRTYIEQPLLEKKRIDERLNAVEELKSDLYLLSSMRSLLDEVYDIERLLSRIAYGSLNGRDVLALRKSIAPLPQIQAMLRQCKSTLLKDAGDKIDTLDELLLYLNDCLLEDQPIGIRDGGLIKSGFNVELDKLHDAKTSGNEWLSNLEKRERESTGIKNLKIGFNKVFGYYIEVTRSNLNAVPYRYTRKQTLAGSERYITPELKELEEMLLTAEEKANKLEYELFLQIRAELEKHVAILQQNANLLAQVDVLQSFAQSAYDYDYVKPTMKTNGVIDIKDGRHPVVERSVTQAFVPNDSFLDSKEDKLLLITGPNMAGKSTFMRQTGLIVLMAQMGSFVPASTATISIVDRVFTRVGAADDLASGYSTFMVEMNELASILRNATNKSLLILDEIGRGTSTLDGLSIAWATIEYILGEQGIGAKTLFATHYHELVSLEGNISGVKNYSVRVKEFNKSIVFLHKIARGGTDRSFGVEVAKLAGLPTALTDRAKTLLAVLEQNADMDIAQLDTQDVVIDTSLQEKAEKLIGQIKMIDVNTLTPLEALSILNDLKQRID